MSRRRATAVTDLKGATRGMSTGLAQDVYIAFEQYAIERDVPNAVMLRLVVEAMVRRPDLVAELVPIGGSFISLGDAAARVVERVARSSPAGRAP